MDIMISRMESCGETCGANRRLERCEKGIGYVARMSEEQCLEFGAQVVYTA